MHSLAFCLTFYLQVLLKYSSIAHYVALSTPSSSMYHVHKYAKKDVRPTEIRVTCTSRAFAFRRRRNVQTSGDDLCEIAFKLGLLND